MAKKKMTNNYWNTNNSDSRENAICHVFPINRSIVDMLLDEKPNLKNSPFWKMVWQKIRIPEKGSYYKTVFHGTYIP